MQRFKNILTVIAGVVGAIYLLNPTAGLIELIPDNLPIVGNLDEAAATALVINAFLQFRRGKRERQRERKHVNNEQDTDANA